MASREANEQSYRNHLQRLMSAGPLSDDDRAVLENDRMYLKISPARAREIEAEFRQATEKDKRKSESGDIAGSTITDTGFEKAVDSGSGTTLIPPPDAAKYLEHLEKYGQEFLEAQRTENFYLSEETRERLQKLAKQFELSAADVRNMEQKILAQLYLHNEPPPPKDPPKPPPDPPVTKLDPQIEFLLEEIAGSLKSKNLLAADLQTFELLLKVIKPVQTTQWLDDEALREAIRKFGADRGMKDVIRAKEVIRRIDQLWQDESKGKFGFTTQLEIYGDNVITQEGDLDRKRSINRAQALSFSKQVGWWIRGLEFLKYYKQLDFSMDAPAGRPPVPKGHLPARWFWGIPHQENFLHGGLRLVPERGGCGMDSFAIPAFMYILSKSLN